MIERTREDGTKVVVSEARLEELRAKKAKGLNQSRPGAKAAIKVGRHQFKKEGR